ncbi:MAG: LAGLIDADG family homing endonuclease [Actinomycetota bacterium]
MFRSSCNWRGRMCRLRDGRTLRDGTFNRSHRTWRLAQANVEWLEIVQQVLARVRAKGWIYREGSCRSVWVLETSFRPDGLRPEAFVPPAVDRAFARGYFDAEGGIPKDSRARFYVQLTQKDRDDLADLRRRFERLGLNCGRLHVPSASADPDYWRFYVSARSRHRFIQEVSSWHPLKRGLLELRSDRSAAAATTAD